MPKNKGVNRDYKIRILAIERMLSKDRYITARQIVHRLDLIYDIQVDRKTIYADLIAIDRFLPLEVKAGKYGGYRIMTF